VTNHASAYSMRKGSLELRHIHNLWASFRGQSVVFNRYFLMHR